MSTAFEVECFETKFILPPPLLTYDKFVRLQCHFAVLTKEILPVLSTLEEIHIIGDRTTPMDLRLLSNIPRLTRVTITYGCIIRLGLLPRVRELTLEECKITNAFNGEPLNFSLKTPTFSIGNCCPMLEKLTLLYCGVCPSKCVPLPSEILGLDFSQLGGIQLGELPHLREFTWVGDKVDRFLNVTFSCPKLTRATITNLSSGVVTSLTPCSELQWLTLSGVGKITLSFVNTLLQLREIIVTQSNPILWGTIVPPTVEKIILEGHSLHGLQGNTSHSLQEGGNTHLLGRNREGIVVFPPQLKHLELCSLEPVTDFSFLDGCPALTTLIVSMGRLTRTNTSSLANLTALSKLRIRSFEEGSLTLVRRTNSNCPLLPNLVDFTSRVNHTVVSLAEFTSYSKLERLELHECPKLIDIRYANRLPALRELSLSGCSKLVSVGSLANCPLLKKVTLSWCQIKDLRFLCGHPQLTELHINRCENVFILPSLPNLTTLTLKESDFKNNLTPLIDCRNLRVLTIERCPLTDGSALQFCRKLEYLRLTTEEKIVSAVVARCPFLTTVSEVTLTGAGGELYGQYFLLAHKEHLTKVDLPFTEWEQYPYWTELAVRYGLV